MCQDLLCEGNRTRIYFPCGLSDVNAKVEGENQWYKLMTLLQCLINSFTYLKFQCITVFTKINGTKTKSAIIDL